MKTVGELADLYARVSQKSGRGYALGRHNALVREVFIVKGRHQIEETGRRTPSGRGTGSATSGSTRTCGRGKRRPSA